MEDVLKNAFLTAEMGSAHISCLCWFNEASDACGRAVARSVPGKVALLLLCAFQPLGLVIISQNSEFWAKQRFTTKSRLTTADPHPSKCRTLTGVPMTHIIDILLYEQGHKTCAEPISDVKTRF